MQVGFAGMGIMGVPMSLNILKAGHGLAVYNRNPEKCAPVVDSGAQHAGTPEELARGAEVLVLMLTGPEAVDAVLFGELGAAGALGPGKTVVNMSSVGPEYSRDLAERVRATGAGFVDAPVAGSRKPAEDGALVILAGGEPMDLDRVEPLLLCMGKKVVRCGEAGAGSAMKMANNILLGTMVAGMAQLMRFGGAGGLDRRTLLDVVLNGPMSCMLFQLKEPLFESEEFAAQFPLKHVAKDLRFAREAAQGYGLDAGFLDAVLGLYQRAEDQGLGEEDFAAVYKMF